MWLGRGRVCAVVAGPRLGKMFVIAPHFDTTTCAIPGLEGGLVVVFGNPLNGSVSSATPALSLLLAKGAYLAPGLHGITPSGHVVVLSRRHWADPPHLAVISNALEHDDRSDAELAWLEKELEAANSRRTEVPWIIVTSHYPIFKPKLLSGQANASLKGYCTTRRQARRVAVTECAPAQKT